MLGLAISRWYLLIAAFIVQFCLGSIYAWSVLNHPIDQAIYNDVKKSRAVNTFYITMGVVGATTAILGPVIERMGPRMSVLIGTTLFMIGHIVTALGINYKSIASVYVGYGVINAIGLGMCYVSPVSTLQKWFPDYRGTAAGFAIAGTGAGSTVWSKVYLPTINAVGLPWMLVLLGAIMSCAMVASALVLRVPPPDYTVDGLNIEGNAIKESDEAEEKVSMGHKLVETPSDADQSASASAPTQTTKSFTLKTAMFTPEFLFMYIMFAANQIFGVIVLSRLSSMCTDIFAKSANTASDIVAVNSVFNCCGRLAFSCFSDLLVRFFKVERTYARKVLFYFTLAAQIIIIGSLPTIIRHESFTYFAIEIFVLTSCYGGGLGTIPAFVTDMFGAYNVGPLHGIILTSLALASVVGGITFNNVYNDKIANGISVGEAYIDNMHIIFIFVCIGFGVLFFVRTNSEDRFEPGYHYSVCGKRVISIPSKEKKKVNQGEDNQIELPEIVV